MRSRLTRLATVLTAVTALAVGGSAFASAAHTTAPKPPVAQQTQEGAGSADGDGVQQGDQTTADAPAGQEPSSEASTGSDGDGSAQAAACKAAGIDPSAGNVQYDGQSGTCSLDGGTDSGN